MKVRSWRVVYGIENTLGLVLGVTFVKAEDDTTANAMVRSEAKRMHPNAHIVVYRVSLDKRDPNGN